MNLRIRHGKDYYTNPIKCQEVPVPAENDSMRSLHQADVSRGEIRLALCLLSLYLLFLPADPLTSPDEEILLRTAVSLMQGNRGAVPPLPMGFATKTGQDGHEYPQYGLGLPLAGSMVLYLPWLALDSSNSFEVVNLRAFRLCAVFVNILITIGMVLILRRILARLGLGLRESLLAGLVFGVATVAWTHGRTFFTEPLAGLCVLGSLAVLRQADQDSALSVRRLLLSGLIFAWGILTRLDTLVAGAAFAWESGRNTRTAGDLAKRWFLAGVPVLAALACLAGYNVYRFGSVVSTGYEDQAEGVQFATPLLIGLHGFLFTPGRSLFVFSPILLLAIPGVRALWRRDRRFAVTAFLVVGGYLAVMSKWQNWAGGSDWGPRHIFQITPWLALAGSVYWFERKRTGTWIWLLLAVSVGMQILGLLTDAVLVIREAGLDLNPIAKQMSVYEPSRSVPVLHFEWLLSHSPNLLLIDMARQGSCWVALFLVPITLFAVSSWRLVTQLREGTIAERTTSPESGEN